MAADDGPRTSWVRKPVVWAGGVVVAALGVALTNAVLPFFESILDPLTESGDAVRVLDAATYRSDQQGFSVVFPAGTSFSAADLAELNEQADPTTWLEARGGSAPSRVLVQLVLAGNRKEPVRIIDMEPVATCTAPLSGPYFEDPPAGGEDSIRIDFDLDRPRTPGMHDDGSGESGPFFPAHTISLAQDEQQVLIATASTERQSCDVRFRLTVLDGDERAEVQIPAAGEEPYRVSAQLPLSEYETVYVGGVICPEFVQASREYVEGIGPAPCE